ncbi:MAG: molybdate ABC transporter substrate-binding protein [Chloroflexi bacterium]|nr:molybdate ABC transporter substrate-binding protein [Chloroflexota bacterium]
MLRAIFLVVAILATLSACATLPFAPTPTPPPSPTPTRLAIYADAALANVLRDIGTAFLQQNPGASFEWTFAQPDALRVKLAQAAPPDVLISADADVLSQLESASAPTRIARDPLTVLIPNTNPANVERIEDLNRRDLRIVIAAENTALGQATRALVENFRHDAAFGPDLPQTFYENVIAQLSNGRSVLDVLLQNRADVGIVYASEANFEARRVTALDIPQGLNVPAEYRGILLKSAHAPARAQAFLEYLASPQAQTLWRDYGFEPGE